VKLEAEVLGAERLNCRFGPFSIIAAKENSQGGGKGAIRGGGVGQGRPFRIWIVGAKSFTAKDLRHVKEGVGDLHLKWMRNAKCEKN